MNYLHIDGIPKVSCLQLIENIVTNLIDCRLSFSWYLSSKIDSMLDEKPISFWLRVNKLHVKWFFNWIWIPRIRPEFYVNMADWNSFSYRAIQVRLLWHHHLTISWLKRIINPRSKVYFSPEISLWLTNFLSNSIFAVSTESIPNEAHENPRIIIRLNSEEYQERRRISEIIRNLLRRRPPLDYLREKGIFKGKFPTNWPLTLV